MSCSLRMQRGSAFAACPGWSFTAPRSAAALRVGSGAAQPVTVDGTAGDYGCYVTLFARSEAYLDEFLAESARDAERYTHDRP